MVYGNVFLGVVNGILIHSLEQLKKGYYEILKWARKNDRIVLKKIIN
jgi:hypothetical protein